MGQLKRAKSISVVIGHFVFIRPWFHRADNVHTLRVKVIFVTESIIATSSCLKLPLSYYYIFAIVFTEKFGSFQKIEQ